MRDNGNKRPLPDILLERYLADDLSAELRSQVEDALKSDGDTAERLAFLEKGRGEFLLADPPDQFAHRIVAKVELDRVMGESARGFSWDRALRLFGVPSLAMAAVAVFAITISEDLKDVSPLEEAVYLEKAIERSTPSAPKTAQARAPDGGSLGSQVAAVVDKGSKRRERERGSDREERREGSVE